MSCLSFQTRHIYTKYSQVVLHKRTFTENMYFDAIMFG